MPALATAVIPEPRAPELENLLEHTPYGRPRRLGQGGMGTVYAVEHRDMGRQLALKVLRPDFAMDPRNVDRLRVEAQALARLNHPNIVSVVDFWIDEQGRPFLVMELLQGRTVAEELRLRGRLPLREAVSVARQALSGLAGAHEIGIVHRDIKPENLFLHDVPGHRRVLKVLDFGIARVLPNASPLAPAPLAVPTATQTIVGSPRFISPEGERGERVDARADVFSAGAVLYTMLAGRGPFDSGAPTPAPLTTIDGITVPGALDAVVRRALGPRPEDRYPNARAFLHELMKARRTMISVLSHDEATEDTVLDLFFAREREAWRVHVVPTWLPRYLQAFFDEHGEAYPVTLDLDDLDRHMHTHGERYEKRVAKTGGINLTARGRAAKELAVWLSTALASGVRAR